MSTSGAAKCARALSSGAGGGGGGAGGGGAAGAHHSSLLPLLRRCTRLRTGAHYHSPLLTIPYRRQSAITEFG